ncbi:hypothetical protein PG999_000513 [Apiospora kogelbergensis]|uniref:Uncharacterized protein n=1 Tax=Apiospora kogelbergensis TaxID=1337665 RepID=A0AAW0RBP9_9PEZI
MEHTTAAENPPRKSKKYKKSQVVPGARSGEPLYAESVDQPDEDPNNAEEEVPLQGNEALLDQKTHATISDDVKEIILGPSLHESAYFQAIAPVVDVTDRRDQWRRSAQINLYGLFNDIALNILPASAIKIAYQTLSNVLSRGVYNKIAAFDVSTFWEDPERVIVHLVDEEVQRLALINVLLRGWKRGGVVQNSDRWTPPERTALDLSSRYRQ